MHADQLFTDDRAVDKLFYKYHFIKYCMCVPIGQYIPVAEKL
jgi:hypothetical protein